MFPAQRTNGPRPLAQDIGAAAGIPLALSGGLAVRSLLFDVSPFDATALVATTIVALAIARHGGAHSRGARFAHRPGDLTAVRVKARQRSPTATR